MHIQRKAFSFPKKKTGENILKAGGKTDNYKEYLGQWTV